MSRSPEEFAHLEWMGYVQPVGLVVSLPALIEAGCHVNRNIAPDHARFLSLLPRDPRGEVQPELPPLRRLATQLWGWRDSDLVDVPPRGDLPPELAALETILADYREVLRPTAAVPEYKPREGASPWLMLVQELPPGTDFDRAIEPDSARHWQASPQLRFERLLRETRVPIGLLSNRSALRLVYAPRGESSGHLTFRVDEMIQVAGRPLFAALHMLLSADRLFVLSERERLPALLEASRKYQNTVSTQLAEQVLASLYELVRGFQAAHELTRGELLRDVLAHDPNHVYQGLLTVLMRLVFILYAEDRDLLSTDELYQRHYSVAGLFDALREDAGRFPDTLDQRYGGWARLLTLFRLIHEGGSHGEFRLPARDGYLFDPDRYNFLEGRPWQLARRHFDGPVALPAVSDGVLFRVLSNLLVLDGERLSYRTLDVEQIGSVYEAMMGFDLKVAEGPSLAIKPKKRQGAPSAINLAALLAVKGADRPKWLKEQTDQELTGAALEALKQADSLDALVAALDKRIARNATPNAVPQGAMILQPSDERRRNGAHYTPRSLTRPIVETTLRPVLEQIGASPTPPQILALRLCDPAMGSGAFLVEACRQLGDHLVQAWHAHDCVPAIPPDEDEILHARRLVAQRSLYGVDKNRMAVDLSKLSLWLATLAKEHPFTFLDHSLRCGDSLVGLTRDQLIGFHWRPAPQRTLLEKTLRRRIDQATEARRSILEADDTISYRMRDQKLALADEALQPVRLLGDAVIAAFFAADKDKAREAERNQLLEAAEYWVEQGLNPNHLGPLREAVATLRGGTLPVEPFHWEIEFPEVWGRRGVGSGEAGSGGFDAIVGNPPFVGGRRIRGALGDEYFDWLGVLHEQSSGNADLVAHFFRRAFQLLQPSACLGLIATNTIGQGDTRSTGLRWLCTQNGRIFSARKRLKWPGLAAVVVSVVHVCRGAMAGPMMLDGREVPLITAYLFHSGGHNDPKKLMENERRSFQGSIVLGMGFTFDDSDTSGVASPLSLMHDLITKDRQNSERIFPYLGGEEINESPTQTHYRYVISFADFPLQRSKLDQTWKDASEDKREMWLRAGVVPLDFPGPVAADWPDLLQIVETKVKPDRTRLKANGEFVLRDPLPQRWWHFADKRPALNTALERVESAFAVSQTSKYFSFAMVASKQVFSHKAIVFPTDRFAFFAVLQSRIHSEWADFFGSSLEDRPVYTPSDCFETFPFPPRVFDADAPLIPLETAGRDYYDFRAAIMIRNNEGLTKTYNRFHDPLEASPDILELRRLHAEMDRAVLEAYGWHDLAADARCEFLLDYEDDEEDDEPTTSRRQRKKPWRYRWPDDFRDEVLARLLELNEQRHKAELLLGPVKKTAAKKASKKAAKKAAKKASRPRSTGEGGGLFGEESGE